MLGAAPVIGSKPAPELSAAEVTITPDWSSASTFSLIPANHIQADLLIPATGDPISPSTQSPEKYAE